MALDGAFIYCLKKELESALLSRVDKIYQPSKDELVLSLSKPGFGKKMYISAKPSSARIQFTNQKIENPMSPPMLCMLLRKHLLSAKLTAIRQEGLERVLILEFSAVNDFGDTVTKSLAVELMGRNANIILIGDNGRIEDSVRRTDAESVRRIMPGAVYETVQRSDKYDFLLTDTKKITEDIIRRGGDVFSAVCDTVFGISPVLINDLAPFNKDAADMTDSEWSVLEQNIDLLKSTVKNGGKPVAFINSKGRREFSFTLPESAKNKEFDEYESFSLLLDEFYGEKDSKERMRSKTSSLSKRISTALARTLRRVDNQRREYENTESREKYRIYGELIKAGIHSIRAGESSAELINYYSENFEKISVPLDVRLSPAQNAQKYFKEYRKANTARAVLADLIKKGESEAEYLRSVLHEIENAENDSDIDEITEELVNGKYIKASSVKNKKSKKGSQKLNAIEYISSDGFKIAVGRNNIQNDLLTVKTAGGADMWFHAKDIPGAHVIVFAEGRAVPYSTLSEAAEIAAAHSKSLEGASVRVDYLPAKRVKKPNGAKPGMVVYENYSTAIVKKDSEKIKALLKK